MPAALSALRERPKVVTVQPGIHEIGEGAPAAPESCSVDGPPCTSKSSLPGTYDRLSAVELPIISLLANNGPESDEVQKWRKRDQEAEQRYHELWVGR